jgi:hypothetical protein
MERFESVTVTLRNIIHLYCADFAGREENRKEASPILASLLFVSKMGEWCYGAYSLMVLRGLHSLDLRWVDGAMGLTQFKP